MRSKSLPILLFTVAGASVICTAAVHNPLLNIICSCIASVSGLAGTFMLGDRLLFRRTENEELDVQAEINRIQYEQEQMIDQSSPRRMGIDSPMHAAGLIDSPKDQEKDREQQMLMARRYLDIEFYDKAKKVIDDAGLDEDQVLSAYIDDIRRRHRHGLRVFMSWEEQELLRRSGGKIVESKESVDWGYDKKTCSFCGSFAVWSSFNGKGERRVDPGIICPDCQPITSKIGSSWTYCPFCSQPLVVAKCSTHYLRKKLQTQNTIKSQDIPKDIPQDTSWDDISWVDLDNAPDLAHTPDLDEEERIFANSPFENPYCWGNFVEAAKSAGWEVSLQNGELIKCKKQVEHLNHCVLIVRVDIGDRCHPDLIKMKDEGSICLVAIPPELNKQYTAVAEARSAWVKSKSLTTIEGHTFGNFIEAAQSNRWWYGLNDAGHLLWIKKPRLLGWDDEQRKCPPLTVKCHTHLKPDHTLLGMMSAGLVQVVPISDKSNADKANADIAAPFGCPICADRMVLRKNGKTGSHFLGCSRFPKCRGSRETNGTLNSYMNARVEKMKREPFEVIDNSQLLNVTFRPVGKVVEFYKVFHGRAFIGNCRIHPANTRKLEEMVKEANPLISFHAYFGIHIFDRESRRLKVLVLPQATGALTDFRNWEKANNGVAVGGASGGDWHIQSLLHFDRPISLCYLRLTPLAEDPLLKDYVKNHLSAKMDRGSGLEASLMLQDLSSIAVLNRSDKMTSISVRMPTQPAQKSGLVAVYTSTTDFLKMYDEVQEFVTNASQASQASVLDASTDSSYAFKVIDSEEYDGVYSILKSLWNHERTFIEMFEEVVNPINW